MKRYFGTLNRPLYYIYISVQSGGFPEEMKIARSLRYLKEVKYLI